MTVPVILYNVELLGRPPLPGTRQAARRRFVIRRDIATSPLDPSPRVHTVMTGIAVAWDGWVESDVAEVEVEFRPLDDAEIERYIDTGEPLDKAGPYGIQGGSPSTARVGPPSGSQWHSHPSLRADDFADDEADDEPSRAERYRTSYRTRGAVTICRGAQRCAYAQSSKHGGTHPPRLLAYL